MPVLLERRSLGGTRDPALRAVATTQHATIQAALAHIPEKGIEAAEGNAWRCQLEAGGVYHEDVQLPACGELEICGDQTQPAAAQIIGSLELTARLVSGAANGRQPHQPPQLTIKWVQLHSQGRPAVCVQGGGQLHLVGVHIRRVGVLTESSGALVVRGRGSRCSLSAARVESTGSTTLVLW
jgi:hypothetical protein